MRSHLTRHVYRRLLAEQPVIIHRPIRRAFRTRSTTCYARPLLLPPQRRTFLNLFSKPKRDLRRPSLDPGMEKMLELEKRIHLIVRQPPVDVLSDAFNAFISSKRSHKQPVVQDFHAARLLQTFNSIEEQISDDERIAFPFSRENLSLALQVLSREPEKASQPHKELAYKLYDRLQGMNAGEDPEQTRMNDLQRLNSILCETGDTTVAEQRLLESIKTSPHHQQFAKVGWKRIASGFAKEGNEQGLLRMLENLKQLELEVPFFVERELALFYARRDNVAATKKWFKPQMFIVEKGKFVNSSSSASEALRTMLEFALRNSEMQWATTVIESAQLGGAREQDMASATVQAAAATGKSVDEVDSMIEIISMRAEQRGEPMKPDVELFNDLISFATSRKQPYTAERFFNLLNKWGVVPNARTYILQIEYRLDADDLSGAQSSYALLRDQPIVDNQDFDIMNKLIQVLSSASDIPSDIIFGLAEDISDRKLQFPAATVKALCAYHINRDEYFEVVDLLQTYAYQFSMSQREDILELLASVAMDPKVDTGRCWDTYMIFHQVFDVEAKRELRQKMMSEMFRRGRPDLATHVFTRMSRHSRADTRPDKSTYIDAFVGIAATREPEAVEVVHNILKLDTEVEPDTVLLNALMMAYVSISMPIRAIQFWQQVSTSDEGPTYESILIALRACEDAPFGHQRANEIWQRLIAADVEITRDLATAYVGALSGNNLLNEAIILMRSMPEDFGMEPDKNMFGVFFNACKSLDHQEGIVDWFHRFHPDVWQEFEAQGIEEDERGHRMINGIDRTLRP